MKIFLIRHGEAQEGGDGSLTKRGAEQSKFVAKRIAEFKIDKAYASSLIRAKQTCEEFLKLNNVEYEFTPDLNEIYRVIIGGPVREGTPKDREDNDRQRADKFFNQILESDLRTVVIFAHGNIIRYFLSKALNIKEANLWQKLVINSGSISIIEKSGSEIKVQAINLVDHLPKEDLEEFYKTEKNQVYLS